MTRLDDSSKSGHLRGARRYICLAPGSLRIENPFMRIPSTIPLLLLAVGPLAHAAQPVPDNPTPQADVERGTVSIYFENDLFGGTDRFYTNGTKLGWSSTDLAKFSDTLWASPLLPLINNLPFVNNPAFQKNLAFSLGQNIYTPDDTESRVVVKDDRPYAGWLYVGLGLVWKNAAVRHSLVLNVGVVGSWSYAEQSQKAVHEARDLGVPQGWDNQLHNELGVLAVYEAKWRWPVRERRSGLDWEFLPHAGAALGNVQIYANLGGEFRFGINLPDDFGTSGIDAASTTSTPVEGRQQAARTDAVDLGLYLFARADGRVVARNIFLDGNTFGNSHSVDRKWLVGDLAVGASVNYKNTKLTYSLVYRTKEFDTQEEGQLFGSISVNYAF